MPDSPLPFQEPPVRLRRTGTRRDRPEDDPLRRRSYLPRRPTGRGVYGGLILVLVLVGFALQYQWMRRTQERGSTDIVPQGFAEKLTRWMLQKKGLAEEPIPADGWGAEKMDCGTCMGSGMILSDGPEKEVCPICLGVGFRMVRRLDPADRICPACVGMGRVEMPDTGDVETCPRCKGRGLIRSQAGPDSAPAGP